MSKEFIEERIGSRHLRKAAEQQKQIQYFIQSEIQQDVTEEYLNQWAHKEYRTDDYFLNFVKTALRTDNFMAFFKFLRNPNPSSGLINDTIIPALQRVFFSEDSHFKYKIKGEEVSCPDYLNPMKFNDWIFRSILFCHNDILVHDLKEANEPYRFIVDIDNVVAIESRHSEIHRIAYSGTARIMDELGQEEEKLGYVYYDEYSYKFYDQDYNLLIDEPHDLGECPADYIVPYPFSDDDPVRKSLFSYARERLEEYTFLKTLQRLSEVNGTFPITVKLKTTENKKEDEVANPHPLSSGKLPKSNSSINAGTIVSVPVNDIVDENGKVNMDAVEKFFKFFHFPVDILEFINKRIKQVEDEITLKLLGDFKERNEEAMNRSQVKKGYISAEDRLRVVSKYLSRIRTISDYKMLALEHGKENVYVDAFYGSDFFLDSEEDLYNLFEKSPNTVERKNILKKIASTRYKFNKERSKRESILYDLMPFVSDKDFEFAKDQIDEITFLYQTRFNYWISKFESDYGDIVSIWDSMDTETNSEKLIFINNFIENYIKDYVKNSSSNIQDNEISP